MTLGWHIGHLEGMKYFFKEGGGYRCEMRINQKEKIASIMMINETSAGCNKYLNAIDKAFLSA
jgi:D-alanyl-D-alanine carboxypeptidase